MLIKTMDRSQLEKLISYWTGCLLDETAKKLIRSRATVVLALIGATLPEMINMRACKDICVSLEAIINDKEQNPFRLLAIELIGFGFTTWEPHLNCAAIIRLLMNLSGLRIKTNAPTAALSASNMLMARHSLMLIARANARLFITTLTFDLVHSKDMTEKLAILKFFGIFITKVSVY
jgi:hypothetical protein